MTTHKIQFGDTLSTLAKRYNTNVETLKKLNSDQIKDIDLIFDGETLVIPEIPDNAPGERVEKLVADNVNLTLTQCTVPEYVDGLLIPNNPTTGKQQFFLLTKSAKDMILKDSERCSSALSGTKEKVLKELTKLGVMDQFNSIAHEAMLRRVDEKKVPLYRLALLERQALRYSISQGTFDIPDENQDLGLVGVIERAEEIERDYNDRMLEIEDKSEGIFYKQYDYRDHAAWRPAILKEDVIKDAEKKRVESFIKLQNDLVITLQEKIESFEKEAMEYAKTIKINEYGYTYQYSTKHKYYTSNIELKASEALDNLNKSRRSIGLCDYLKSNDLTVGDIIPSLEDAVEIYDHWESHADSVLNSLRNTKYGYRPKSFFNFNSENRVKEPDFFAAVYELNQGGMLVKEQCLSKDELFLGWEKIESLRELIEGSASIDQLVEKIKNIDTPQLGYYSAYVGSLLILKEVGVRIKDFSKKFGENESYADYVRQLMFFSDEANKRCEKLKQTAKNKEHAPVWNYRRDNLIFIGDVPCIIDSTLLWDEPGWTPTNLDNFIFCDGGINQRTVVECSLSSEPEKLIYILSDNPVISEDLAINKKCSSPLKFDFSHKVTASEDRFMDALKDALGQTIESKLQKWELKEQATMSNLPDLLLPWRTKHYDNIAFGYTGRYESSGGAQFFRFVRANSLSLESGPGSFKAESENSFDLASTQYKFTLVIPDNKGFKLDIPYKKRDVSETQIENLGFATIKVEGQVYGVLGATLELGTEIHMGNISSEANGESSSPLGIRGTSYNMTDSTSYENSTVNVAGQPERPVTAGAKAEAKAFAGIEAGGSLSCEYLWKKDQKSEQQSLFKVASELKFSAGIGYSGVLQCTYQNGRFIFITDVSATTGMGFGGKLATELNPLAANDFVSALLNIMGKKGFQYFEFFDDEADTFYYFNQVLTVAAAFGLTIGQVLLLPFKIIDNMVTQATDQKNAYFVANFILSDKYTEVNQDWISKMPAETLSKLLTVLTHYHEFPYWGEDDKARAANRNQNQRHAINKILRWLGGNKPNNTQIRRFENAVQRIGLEKPTELEKLEQWDMYASNIMKLNNFFTRALLDKYENKEGSDKRKYMRDLNRDIDDFKSYMFRLTEQHKVYERVILVNRDRRKYEYMALSSSEDEAIENINKKGFSLINWL